MSGADLAEAARQQAVHFGAELLLMREGVDAEFSDGGIVATLADGHEMRARANICATGVTYRTLGLADEVRFTGASVYYGAGASEAMLCGGDHVFVVGGGNSATGAQETVRCRRLFVCIGGAPKTRNGATGSVSLTTAPATC